MHSSVNTADKIEVDGIQRSRLNSGGQLIHSSEDEIMNFWRWFGNSKIVDDNGRPLPMYHGSPNKVGESAIEKPATFGVQFFDNEDWCKHEAGTSGLVVAAYLKLDNPYEIDLDIRSEAEDTEKSEDELSYGEYYPTSPSAWYSKMGCEEIVHQLRDGYEGYLISGEGDVLVGVMSPKQIQSLDLAPVVFMMPLDVDAGNGIEDECSHRMA